MMNLMAEEKNKELLIDWVPNFIAEMPLHLQLTKVILSKAYALSTGSAVYLSSAKKLSQKFRVPESVIMQAFDRLHQLGLINTLTGTRLRILSKPTGDLASQLKCVTHYHLKRNPCYFLPRTQLI